MINPFKKSYSAQELNLFRFLSRIKLFERLTYEEMAHFIPHMYLRSYKSNEVVFFRDDPSHALYIVKNGQVSLNIDIKERFEVLTTIRSGGAFGENALLENSRRIYSSIVISEKADLYVVPQINILEIFENDFDVRAKVMTSLSELYNDYIVNLFKAYKSSFGFFNLEQVYSIG